MTPAEAARVYQRLKPKFEELAAEARELAAAEDVLKAHFKATPELRSYRGVGCKVGSRRTFVQAIAKELLGRKAEQCYTDTPTASLFLL